MAVKIEKKFQVKEPVEEVWAFLSDPGKVVTCVPGARITEKVDERAYKGSVSVKVGPSVSDYSGDVQVVRLDPQAHEIEILGKGQDVRGKGSASMKMTGKVTATPAGGSEVVSVSELTVVGILAQMGGRMIQEVSNIMFEQFMKNFQQKLQTGSGGGATNAEPSDKPKPVNAISTAFSALKSAVKRRDNPPSPEPPQSAAASEASKSSKSRETGDDPETKE